MDQPTRKAHRRRGRADALPKVVRIGLPKDRWRDLYHSLLVLPWSGFFAILVGFYLAANTGFATLFLLQRGAIAGAETGTWLEAFFFSVETMATVGYGVLHPGTLYGHIVATTEIIFGVMVVPLATGLVIAKFTRPTARILFSRHAVITAFEGRPTLIFRAANLRSNQIIEGRAQVSLLRRQTTEEGHQLRRIIDLPLVRETSPIFALSWSVMHRIDAASPLAGADAETLHAADARIIVVMTGIDGTTSSTVHATHQYTAGDIRFDHAFVDVVSLAADGTPHIDFNRFHETRPAPPAAAVEPVQRPPETGRIAPVM